MIVSSAKIPTSGQHNTRTTQMTTIKTEKIIISNGPAGTFKVSELGSIGKLTGCQISSQLRETFEQADELARTIAVMRKLNAIHDATR